MCYFDGIGGEYTYWDARSSAEDMEEMWNHHDVAREWSKSGEKRGKVRFSHDKDKIPYLSQIEVKVRSNRHKHFSKLVLLMFVLKYTPSGFK